MRGDTKDWLLGDRRQLLFMAIGAVLGALLGLAFLEGRSDIVSMTVICMFLGQFLNQLLRRREKRIDRHQESDERRDPSREE